MRQLLIGRGLVWTCVGLAASALIVACAGQPSGGVAPQPTTGSSPAGAPQAQAVPTQQPQQAASPSATTAPAATPKGQVLGMQAVPPCTPGAELTPAQTQGPYYRANPPQRSSLVEPGMAGTRLALSGYVVTADCQPVSGARVDFWQADDQGRYDNSGYTLRGYTLTDENGRYTMETIVPGLYPGRTRHIHVKVQAPNGPTLTSQLYFPNEPANERDSIFDQRLVMDVKDAGSAREATFNFVISTR